MANDAVSANEAARAILAVLGEIFHHYGHRDWAMPVRDERLQKLGLTVEELERGFRRLVDAGVIGIGISGSGPMINPRGVDIVDHRERLEQTLPVPIVAQRASTSDDVAMLLRVLGDRAPHPEKSGSASDAYWTPAEVSSMTSFSAARLRRAVNLLEERGHADALRALGTAPYGFAGVRLTDSGMLAYEELDRVRTPREHHRMPDPKKVFVIHGRNLAAKHAVDQFLRSLKLESIDFDELAASMGTEFVGNIVVEGLNRAQGIVALFTPDEYSTLLPALRGQKETGGDVHRWQARPNVIFEAGIAFGIARDRTVLATVGSDVGLFSDVNGIHLVRLDNTVPNRGKFRKKLLGAGCSADTHSDEWTDPQRSGDFEACLAPLQGVSPRDPF